MEQPTATQTQPITDDEKKNFPIALISLYNAYNLGIRYIHALLKDQGYNVQLIFLGRISANDAVVPSEKDYENLLNILRDNKIKFVGMSISCSTYFETGCEIAKRIKNEMPEITQLWGGVHATLCSEDCLEYADFVCKGEGEYPTLDLVNALIRKGDTSKIDSIWFKDSSGEIVKTQIRHVITDLDVLPYPTWDDDGKWVVLNDEVINEEIAKRDTWVFTMTSRGCPFHCTYCVNNAYHLHYSEQGMNKMRFRSVDNVIDELRIMRDTVDNFKHRHIGFYDDEFSVSKEWITEFSKKFTAEFDNTFWCYFHPNLIKEEMVVPLRNMGLTQIDMGVQTGSDRVRKDIYHRPESNAKILSVMKMLQQNKISVALDVITDNPYENEEDKIESLDFFLSLPRPYEINFYSLIWFPGVELTQWALRDGHITRDDVEDRSKKTMEQFVATFKWDKRTDADTFWIMLYFMAARGIYNRGFIHFLSTQTWIKKNIWILRFLYRLMNLLNMMKKGFKAIWYLLTGKMSISQIKTRWSNYLVWEKPFEK
ncbi:B12-binding domain-containing radical SAM protein [bacterium]|nr:B12-binding domain-containing radical SAM protein [bacterium]